MNNEIYIDILKKFEPHSKAMKVAISGVEILSYISNESNNKPVIFFMSKKKIFIFQHNKETTTEIYSLDKISEMSMINQTRRRGTIQLVIDSQKKYLIPDCKKENLLDFISLYEDLLNNFKEKTENNFLKNIDIIDDYSDSDLLKNIQNIENFKKEFNPIKDNERIEEDKKQNMNNQSKSKRIVDDNQINDDTTFSSKYIYNLLSKKNILLPDGKLSNIDKINSKVNELDINSQKLGSKGVDKNFIQDIKSALLKINEKVNLLKEDIEGTITKKVSFTDSKIKEVAENSVDQKEVIKLKYSIENIKNEIEKELKDFVKITNEKMMRVSENLISDEVLKKIDDKIFKSKKEFLNEVENIKNSLKEKMIFTHQVADRQIDIIKDLKKYSNTNDSFEDEIYTVQKAWVENNKRFSILDDRMIKLENLWKNQTNSINNVIAKLKERVGSSENENIEKSSTNNEWFLDTIYNTSDKILAVNHKGKGIYFDVDEFKKDIDKTVVQSKNELNITVDEKVLELKKFLISNIEELSTKKEDDIIEKSIPKKESIIKIFKSKGYIHNGMERNGIRPGQTLSLKMEKNTPGVDSIYFCEESKEPLYINKFDGIIFCNKKYYLNVPREFSSEKKNYFRINHIEYSEGSKPYRSYEISIHDNLFEYKVYDEKGHLITDNDSSSYKYDLKWLTFFKD